MGTTPGARVRRRREVRGVEMPLEMVDAEQRNAACEGEGLRGREADEQRPDQARPRRGRDEPDFGQSHSGLRERLLEHRGQVLQMRAGRQLRHDAAVARVRPHLRGDDVGSDRPVVAEYGHRGLVAGGLDAEDDQAALRPTARRRLSPNGGEQIPCSVTMAVM